MALSNNAADSINYSYDRQHTRRDSPQHQHHRYKNYPDSRPYHSTDRKYDDKRNLQDSRSDISHDRKSHSPRRDGGRPRYNSRFRSRSRSQSPHTTKPFTRDSLKSDQSRRSPTPPANSHRKPFRHRSTSPSKSGPSRPRNVSFKNKANLTEDVPEVDDAIDPDLREPTMDPDLQEAIQRTIEE